MKRNQNETLDGTELESLKKPAGSAHECLKYQNVGNTWKYNLDEMLKCQNAANTMQNAK